MSLSHAHVTNEHELEQHIVVLELRIAGELVLALPGRIIHVIKNIYKYQYFYKIKL